MFEQSLVVSQVGRVSTGERWTWAGSMAVQGCAAASLLLLPMLRPEGMSLAGKAPRVFVPLQVIKVPEVKVRRVESASSMAVAAVAAASTPLALTAPPMIPHGIPAGEPPTMSVTGFMGSGTGLPTVVASLGPAARVGVAAAPRAETHGPVRVSSGVAAGQLMTPIRPIYPAIARAARVEGVVVVAAVISREGRIERAHVVSGPAMLATAALEAVSAARYAPFRLNGEATEVETTITVNFRMGV